MKPRPPATVIGLSKQKGAEELISSSSDSDENDDGYVHVTAGQIERFRSQRRKSGGDFESVASWVHHKKDSLLQGGREGDGFGRVNSFPNISDQSRSQGLSSQESNRLSDEGATGVHVTSMSVRRQSTKRKFAQSRHQLIRRSSSLGSSLDEDQVYTSVKTIASEAGKGKGDAPGSHGSLISNDMYGGSWQSPTSAANGNGDLDGEQQATDSLLHHYESVKELGLTRQSASIDSNPDYDYVKGEFK